MVTFFRNKLVATTASAALLLAVVVTQGAQAQLIGVISRNYSAADRTLADRTLANCAVSVSCYVEAKNGEASMPKKKLKIGFIGDSITCGYNQVGNTIAPGKNDVAALTVKKLSAESGATIANEGTPWNAYDKGVSATSSADWQPGPPENLYGVTKAAFIASFGKPDPKRNPVWVFIMLGTNDVRSDRLFSATQHQANLQAIVNDLVASGFNVMLNHAPSFVAPTSFNGVTWSAAALELLRSYVPGEKAVVASFARRAPGRVFLGDTNAVPYFTAHPALFQEYGVYGGLHPNGTGGTEALADCWTSAFRRIINQRNRKTTTQTNQR